jgi:hypothetical protein
MKETVLAESLGMSRQALTAWRGRFLDPGGWDGQEKAYTAQGLVQVRKQFGLEEELAPLDEIEGVIDYLPRNPRLVMVKVDGVEGRCRLRVKDQDLFVRGMVVRMVPVLDTSFQGVYRLVGKEPKRRGVW